MEKLAYEKHKAGQHYHDLIKIYYWEILHGTGEDVNRTLSQD
jgi:hypothetical protein